MPKKGTADSNQPTSVPTTADTPQADDTSCSVRLESGGGESTSYTTMDADLVLWTAGGSLSAFCACVEVLLLCITFQLRRHICAPAVALLQVPHHSVAEWTAGACMMYH